MPRYLAARAGLNIIWMSESTAILELSQAAVPVCIEIPTLRAPGRIGNNTDLQARRADALLKGSSAINKGFLVNALKASRRLHVSIFTKELDLLNRTLTSLERIPDEHTSSHGYRVGRDNYLLLLHVLSSLRSTAADAFRLRGLKVPTLPSWGNDEDISQVYDANNFEILGVCFRAEVEHFLSTLDGEYDFLGKKGRHDTMTHAAAEFLNSRPDQTAAVTDHDHNADTGRRLTPFTTISPSTHARRTSVFASTPQPFDVVNQMQAQNAREARFYNIVADVPWILFAEELVDAYPDTRVILKTRDPD
ncbi:hypothetical protein C8R46DRAFT_1223010 [Mycena filopes]|nr:hypothetical protein C8R46DRAFT_1223010 [Mycena filopes]